MNSSSKFYLWFFGILVVYYLSIMPIVWFGFSPPWKPSWLHNAISWLAMIWLFGTPVALGVTGITKFVTSVAKSITKVKPSNSTETKFSKSMEVLWSIFVLIVSLCTLYISQIFWLVRLQQIF